METPTSDFDRTVFSAPALELDDHRLPASSDTHADAMENIARSRHGTGLGQAPPPQNAPALLHVNEALRQAMPVSRDFESVVIDDDDKSITSAKGKHGRRSTMRRSHDQQDSAGRSPGSSRSSSSSRPHSVDAFADMRQRERANTFCSTAPPELDEVLLQRTISGAQRRPTFGAESVPPRTILSDKASVRSVGDESLFQNFQGEPVQEIDFEELEDFVAQNTRGRSLDGSTPRRTQSISCQSPHRLQRALHDFRHGHDVPDDAVVNIVSPGRSDELLSGFAASSDENVGEKKTEQPVDDKDISATPELNRYSFFSSEGDTTIHAAELGDLLLPGETFSQLFALPPDSGVWWLHLLQPRADEIAAIAKAFDIHRLTEEDIRETEEREKIELFPNYYFVSFRSFNQDPHSEDYLDPIQLYIVVFRTGVLSFSYTYTPHAANVRSKIGNYRATRSIHSDWICYALIDNIVDSFMPHIQEIEREADSIEDQVFVARAEDLAVYMRQISQCRKKVMTLIRLLGSKADIIKGFAKRCTPDHAVTPRSDIGLYLGDIQDHIVTIGSNLQHYEKMLSRSHANYLAQANMESIAAGTRNNEVLNRITLIATLLVPLNLITGLFGMNVKVPGREADNYAWFFGIVGSLIVFVAIGATIAKRMRIW